MMTKQMTLKLLMDDTLNIMELNCPMTLRFSLTLALHVSHSFHVLKNIVLVTEMIA